MARVHIIGAGLAGLSAAVRLSAAGQPITLYESSDQAGGRCRSYFDKRLDRVIDNGNHLLFSGNKRALTYLDLIGARGGLVDATQGAFPFFDLASGDQWSLSLGQGALPLRLFDKSACPAGASPWEFFHSIAKVFLSKGDRPLDHVLKSNGPLWRGFWEPLAVAALNMPAREASSQLLRKVLKESFLKGGAYSLPLVTKESLASCFIDPALSYLRQRGGVTRFNRRVRRLTFQGPWVRALWTDDEPNEIAESDFVISALPAWGAEDLMPGIKGPERHCAILNAHFAAPQRPPAETPAFLGLLGGLAQWVFCRDDLMSVTVSAADEQMDQGNDQLAAALWSEINLALKLGAPELPERYRIIKERRATPWQGPDRSKGQSGPLSPWKNLVLAGDWTRPDDPATIETAIRSGEVAAKMVLDSRI